jgi:hypothetical protein
VAIVQAAAVEAMVEVDARMDLCSAEIQPRIFIVPILQISLPFKTLPLFCHHIQIFLPKVVILNIF